MSAFLPQSHDPAEPVVMDRDHDVLILCCVCLRFRHCVGIPYFAVDHIGPGPVMPRLRRILPVVEVQALDQLKLRSVEPEDIDDCVGSAAAGFVLQIISLAQAEAVPGKAVQELYRLPVFQRVSGIDRVPFGTRSVVCVLPEQKLLCPVAVKVGQPVSAVFIGSGPGQLIDQAVVLPERVRILCQIAVDILADDAAVRIGNGFSCDVHQRPADILAFRHVAVLVKIIAPAVDGLPGGGRPGPVVIPVPPAAVIHLP